jgi:hypothetical protein
LALNSSDAVTTADWIFGICSPSARRHGCSTPAPWRRGRNADCERYAAPYRRRREHPPDGSSRRWVTF